MIRSIGIVGGGIMGSGLARHFLTKGFPVVVVEAGTALAEKFKTTMAQIFSREIRKGQIKEEEASAWFANLSVDAGIGSLKKSDLIIEAVNEDVSLKKSLLSDVERYVLPDTIITTNTSAIPISALAAALSHPERFLGTHFFNPAHIMPLVEVVPGLDSSHEVTRGVLNFLSSTGKKPVPIKECPGFLVNRVLGSYINEAMWLLQDSAGIQDIDACGKDLGLPMGPATLGDMVGWDVIHASNRTLEIYYGKRFEIPPLLHKLDTDKRHGLKSGIGLFDHSTKPPRVTNDLAPSSCDPDSNGMKDIKERLLLAIIAEGLRCLDEGVAIASDLDMALVLGAGLPKGPVAWADELGLELVLDRLENLSFRLGPRFWPSPILRIHVLAGYNGRFSGRGLAGKY